MNGLELVDWILSNRPGVKVLVTTGRALDRDVPPIAGALLAKPYTGRDLLDRVKQALAKPANGGESTSGAGEAESRAPPGLRVTKSRLVFADQIDIREHQIDSEFRL